MSDLRQDPDEQGPELAFVTTPELIDELMARKGLTLLVIYEDSTGAVCHRTTASPLWAENAAKYTHKKLRAAIDAVRENEASNGTE